MKHFQSIIKTVAICCLSFFLYYCEGGDKYQGDFRFNEEERGFMIKDTITKTFKMMDNHGITDEFTNSPGYNYNYLQISRPLLESQEQFMFRSKSLLSNCFFEYELVADKESTKLKIGMYPNSFSTFVAYIYDFPAIYDFKSKKVTTYNDQFPDVKFYDEMEVRGIVYHKIIEIDYSKDQDKLQNGDPVQTYYSTEKGLIKFIRKDGIYFERI